MAGASAARYTNGALYKAGWVLGFTSFDPVFSFAIGRSPLVFCMAWGVQRRALLSPGSDCLHRNTVTGVGKS